MAIPVCCICAQYLACRVLVSNSQPKSFSEESLSGQAEWRLDMKKGLSMKASGAQ